MPGLKIAQMNTMNVVSVETEGYHLENEDGAIFLPRPDATQKLDVNDTVDVFLYFDQSKAVTSTMQKPLITAYEPGFVDVVDQKQGLGVFVHIGLKKDMLLSKDDLPHLKDEWPQKGDRVFCQLKAGRNQMVAKIPSRFQVLKRLQPDKELNLGDEVDAFVFNLGPEGIVLFTEHGHELYVYYKHTRKNYRIGEKVRAKISYVTSRVKYNATLSEQKELSLEKDAQRIYDYLLGHPVMPFGDKSEPEAIFQTFHMSKAAFKRALGSLYKDKLVKIFPQETHLLNKE
jgi:predicted RNA-binding protein (virulence factor B family)